MTLEYKYLHENNHGKSNVSDMNNDISSFKHKQEHEMKKQQEQIENIKTFLQRPWVESTSFDNELNVKSFSSDREGAGKEVVSSTKYSKIIELIQAKCILRQLASIETISSNALDIIVQSDIFASGWVGERDERAVTENPELQQKRIVVHELYAQPKASQRLLDDSFVNLESWLVEKLSDSFSYAENSAFISGDGNGKPHGILHYGNNDLEAVTSENDNEITVDDILRLINAMDDVYLANASLLMHRRTLSMLQSLKDANERFVWQPSISSKMSDTLFGIPVLCTNAMPLPEAGKKAIILGDFKAGYKIVDRHGMSIMKDPYTDKPFVKFYATKRVGGDVVNNRAFKTLLIKE